VGRVGQRVVCVFKLKNNAVIKNTVSDDYANFLRFDSNRAKMTRLIWNFTVIAMLSPFISCENAQQTPTMTTEGQTNNYYSSGEVASLPSGNENVDVAESFRQMTIEARDKYSGLWKLVKRDPANEPIRMIQENYYIEFKPDFTYDAKSFDLGNSGNWLPYFNKMFADTLSTLVVLGKNKTYHRDLVDIYSLSIQIDNGVTYLRMADWEDGDVDFYVRQN
jgi:hypothetical protein